jgi:hypothetical protein
LVLGGDLEIQLNGYTDAALGKGPQGRSVIGNLLCLNKMSGAISAKTKATRVVHTSSFEAELEGIVSVEKMVSSIRNIFEEINIPINPMSILISDNEAMLDFVQGESIGNGVKHMELKMWYFREKYKIGNLLFEFMEGKFIPTDRLTKPGSFEQHKLFVERAMGHALLE